MAVRGRARAVRIGIGIRAPGRHGGAAAAAGENEKEQGKKGRASHIPDMVAATRRFMPPHLNFA
jgi:hypothetical protein